MIEPLPKARSICESAASSALVLSTKVPSTTRRLAELTALLLLSRSASSRQILPGRPPRAGKVHVLFSYASSFFVLVENSRSSREFGLGEGRREFLQAARDARRFGAARHALDEGGLRR